MTMYLYRKLRQAVTLGWAIGLIACGLQAQFRAPQPERKTPRAVGVLETFKNGSRRLVPVTFFYERHYYDATFYRATPVPFTLYPETVYEVQQYGKAIGTFTVVSASERPAQDTDKFATAWFGNGRYRAAAAMLAKKKASAPHHVTLEDPSRPVLHRRAGSDGDNPVVHPAETVDSGQAQADDDPERPRLHRSPGSGGDTGSASTPGQAPGGAQDSTSAKTGAGTQAAGEDDPDRPKLHRKDDSGSGAAAPAGTGSTGAANGKAGTAAGTPTTSAGATAGAEPTVAELTPSDDPEHPVLRRGKPAQEQSGRDLPEFHPVDEPGGRPAAAGGAAGRASEEAVTRQVAVSDAGPSEAQSVIYVCREEQRKQMEAAARELAEAELRRVATQRNLVLPAPGKAAPAKPAKGRTASTKTGAGKKNAAAETAAVAELKLQDEQFVPYDLEYNNYATVVYSGRYVQEAASAQSSTAGEANASTAEATGAGAKSWVVTVIGREDEGKLVKLYSAVSDPKELDLYPEVRLVDAVDPEGYGRYGLLFREQKRDGVSWLLGRVTGYELQTVFETAVR